MMLLSLLSCDATTPMPSDMPCNEARYAIEETALRCLSRGQAEELMEALDEQYTCVEVELGGDTALTIPDPSAYFRCALTARYLSCDLVQTYGTTPGLWLGASASCLYVLAGKAE